MTRIVFMGTPDFSVTVLEKIIADGYEVIAVVTQPDRPVGRKRVLTPPPVKVAAEKHDIPVLQPEKIRDPEELRKVFAFKPDLLITAAFGQILPKELLDFPKYGCINVHASLLPELRGGAPIHYALMQGKVKTGVTIMYMAERLDAGDMISKVEVEIDEIDHTGSLHKKLSRAGSELLSETLPKLLAGEIIATPQDESLATFARNIKREQELIDWSKPGRAIYNHIRGLHPWPVAYTTLDGVTVKIWWGTPIESSNLSGLPGEVVKVEKDGFIVKSGDSTSIKISDLQLAGKTRMRAEELLRSNHPFQVGTIFGN